tara:strand:- start:1234 stop:2073 length:840 start_codon:yes stop_codon:yes gene_type:complete
MLRKAVLAYMAERANEDGSKIWASKQRIADEVECSKQAVIKTVKEFLAEGILIDVGKRKTQGGYTVVYNVNLDAVEALPKRENQSTEITSNQSTEITGNNMDRSSEITPTSQPGLPKPSNNRPSEKAKAFPDNSAPAKTSLKPDCVSDEVWNDFLAHRKAMKAPVSQTAIKGIAREAERAEWPLEDALAEIVTRGWKGFKADWVKEQETSTGFNSRNNEHQNGLGPSVMAAQRRRERRDNQPSDPLLRASIRLNEIYSDREPERADLLAIPDARFGNDR